MPATATEGYEIPVGAENRKNGQLLPTTSVPSRERMNMRLCRPVAALVLFCALPAHAGPKLEFPVKNLVMDIGGVLVSLSPAEFTARMTPIAGSLEAPAFRAVVESFETGGASEAAFLSGLRALLPENRTLSDEDIASAWNSQIGAADCDAMRMLRALKSKGFKVFTLSTTNPLHVKVIEARMRGCFPGEERDALEAVFDRRFYTCELGLLKPSPAIYKKMLAQGGMEGAKTLFLDDSPGNVVGAQQAGLFSLLVPTIGAGPRYVDWLPKLVGEPAP
ncbi:hypothetical protein EPO15_12440 [bacterium]|nr:MAG: hypothetical protein EPO15_12440 [bacterium]